MPPPCHAGHSVGPDLGPYGLQRLSAEDTRRMIYLGIK